MEVPFSSDPSPKVPPARRTTQQQALKFAAMIDAAAESANSNLKRVNAMANDEKPTLMEAALISLVTQLAYAGTVSAARFYMDYLQEEDS